MALVDQGFAAQRLGNTAGAQALLRQALALETEAAQQLALDFEAEPSRSVLYRSAATLAIDCQELQQAEQLIQAGLAGRQPRLPMNCGSCSTSCTPNPAGYRVRPNTQIAIAAPSTMNCAPTMRQSLLPPCVNSTPAQ